MATQNHFEIARKACDTIQSLLLPGVQQNPLHPFGGANTRIHMTRRTK
jgi:hypothetical protein